MVVGRQPTAWRKDLNDVANLRPITISSLLSRIYWGVIDSNVRNVLRFTSRQKRFICETACFNNVHILSELLRHSEGHRAFAAVVLNINKAFETISHQAMAPALPKKGLPTQLTKLVENSYQDVHKYDN
jgi:hypothetical protein